MRRLLVTGAALWACGCGVVYIADPIGDGPPNVSLQVLFRDELGAAQSCAGAGVAKVHIRVVDRALANLVRQDVTLSCAANDTYSFYVYVGGQYLFEVTGLDPAGRICFERYTEFTVRLNGSEPIVLFADRSAGGAAAGCVY
jgi:hypothetical protein